MELLVLVKADAPNVLEDVKKLVFEGGSDVNVVDHTGFVSTCVCALCVCVLCGCVCGWV